MKKDFVLKTKKDNILRISAYSSDKENSNYCLVYVHGFKGFKNWGFVPYLGEYFSKNGFFVITFNFSHNGVGDSLIEFDELEKFAKNTISLEVEELNEIIDACYSSFFTAKKIQKLGLIGHSRGGGVSILAASHHKTNMLMHLQFGLLFQNLTVIPRNKKFFGKMIVLLRF